MGVIIKVPVCLSSTLLKEEKKKHLDIEKCAHDLDNLRLQEPPTESTKKAKKQTLVFKRPTRPAR